MVLDEEEVEVEVKSAEESEEESEEEEEEEIRGSLVGRFLRASRDAVTMTTVVLVTSLVTVTPP